MPKNIDDISLPERRRSIRNIPIPEGRRKADHRLPPVTPVDSLKKAGASSKVPTPTLHKEEEYIDLSTRRPISLPLHQRGSKKKVWYAIGAGLVVVVFAILSMFDGGTLSYLPRSAALTFENELFKAKKTGDSGLLYSVVKLSRDKGVAAPASAEEQVSRKASGSIIVYNNASAEPQTLIENTRFESPAGKIYRIQKGITIPGKKTVSGASAPGSIEVMVYADEAGEASNSALTDFTVPGLKGSPRYETIYARSKTPMSGGYVGKEKVVKAEDLAKAKASLEAALKNDLWEEARAEVPTDFILFPSLASYTFQDMPQTNSSDSTATVNMKGDMYGVMFKRSDLAKYLGEKKLGLAEADVVDFTTFDTLNLTFDGAAPADLLNLSEISFRVSGSAMMVWRTDEVALRADLLGRHKRDISTILKNYPTIANASATVRPFWKTVMPSVGEKISIKKLPVQ